MKITWSARCFKDDEKKKAKGYNGPGRKREDPVVDFPGKCSILDTAISVPEEGS